VDPLRDENRSAGADRVAGGGPAALRARLGFLHIPKAAGTSVHAALLDAYGEDGVSPLRFDDRFFGAFTEWHTMAPGVRDSVFHPDGPTRATDRAARAFSGHITYRSLVALVEPTDILTVLREPRSRLLSHHAYLLSVPDAVYAGFGTYDAYRPAFAGLTDFLSDPVTAHQTDNLQVRMLADVELDPTRHLTDAEQSAAAAAARRNLGTLGCTTFVEAPTFWRDVSSFVGITTPEPRENVTSGSTGARRFRESPLTDEAVALLDRRTAADRVIYLEVVADTLGLDADAAAAFADRVFAEQAERYERLVETPARPPVTPVRPPVGPAARARARLVGLARRGRRLLG